MTTLHPPRPTPVREEGMAVVLARVTAVVTAAVTAAVMGVAMAAVTVEAVMAAVAPGRVMVMVMVMVMATAKTRTAVRDPGRDLVRARAVVVTEGRRDLRQGASTRSPARRSNR
ncbi:TPA: hypothetical protein ACXM52_000125 [Stenotrophomonas maltophilia]